MSCILDRRKLGTAIRLYQHVEAGQQELLAVPRLASSMNAS
jgi:hypothetical protein